MATPALQGNGILYVAGGATVHYIVLSVVREMLHIYLLLQHFSSTFWAYIYFL